MIRPEVIEKLGGYDRSWDAERVAAGAKEHEEISSRFPMSSWPQLPLEKYAQGLDDRDTFCTWIEHRSPNMGSMRGGSARKLIIYKHASKPGWYHSSDYQDEEQAWEALRAAFVKAFELAEAGRWSEIDGITELQSGRALLVKTLHLYFPAEIIPVMSQTHARHFYELVTGESLSNTLGPVEVNRRLLEALRTIPDVKDWSTPELAVFLYRFFAPNESRRVIKIAPGHNARYWEDCLSGGYICAGWDDVGDLTAYASKDDFVQAYRSAYSDDPQSKQTKKSNELWILRELKPGDLVVANKGISRVLAVGTVKEPGYVYRPDRDEYKHTVAVDWDTTYAKDLEPQKRWGVVTVEEVPGALASIILGSGTGTTAAHKPPSDVVEPIFRDITAALERKGQVILYGPPGTGKTYTARRFATWWLQGAAGVEILSNESLFAQAEKTVSDASGEQRAWWIVGSPAKGWRWDMLFEEGSVDYSYGRLHRNFPLVKQGDLVFGYQSTPDKKLVALARVSRGLESVDGKRTIALQPLTKVNNGLTYEELIADPILSVSEPIRFRNQGTLFALTSDEAEHCLALLTERDPSLAEVVVDEEPDTAGVLTWITFHPSYSYEDFIEGFRPIDTGTGQLVLKLTDGVFKRICREAQSDPSKRFLVFIDEINRANVAKVFGELITLLEKDKRGLVVTLPQSHEPFVIPPNVFVIGTMNTADRSIKLLDAALRRRFAFVELMPDPSLLAGSVIGALKLDEFLEKLNGRVAAREGREKQIGHSFFFDAEGHPISEPEELALVFRQDILPLLQEYCYDDYATLSEYVGSKIVDKQRQVLDQSLLADADSLLTALEEEFVNPPETQ